MKERIAKGKKVREEIAKAAQTNTAVAIKAVSHKLVRASYYVMRDHAVFDEQKLFG